MSKIQVVLQLSLFAHHAASAGPLTVRDAFTSGTTASAAEVNANFSAVAAAVNDNDGRISDNANAIAANADAIASHAAAIAANTAAIQGPKSPIVLDGGRNEIGLLINLTDDHWYADVLTGQGYILTVRLGDGQPGGFTSTVPFASQNCTAQAHTPNAPPGFVISTSDLAGG